MGTRGTCGFRLNGQDKLMYNHFDSYPSGLGVEVVEHLKTLREAVGLDGLKLNVEALVLVNQDTKVTDDIFEQTKPYHNFSVSGQSEEDLYCLFRELQGNLIATLDVGYMLDGGEFIKDSLFCEWGYIINLDTEMLEVWRGFQEKPDPTNRYGQDKDRDYYPCKLIAEFPLATVTPEQVESLE